MLSLKKGRFIVLEGIDGAGKTTIANLLIKDLTDLGFESAYTYEPTDSLIVKAVKGEYNSLRDAYIDALAFALDRLIHVKSLINPLLERGVIVVSDRYYYSSIAYQSAMGAPFEWVAELNRFAPKPDLALYLDIPPEVAIARRKGLESRFPEFEEVSFLTRVRDNYKRMVSNGWLIEVDATENLKTVYSKITSHIYSILKSDL